MEINREKYLLKLINSEKNGLIKVITGIRRSGKSFLLNELFYKYLLNDKKIPKDHIIKMSFDETENDKYLDPHELIRYIKERIKDNNDYYILLDEIQFVDKFEGVLNTLINMKNVDTYVTGSNSKFLASDLITEFRGRSYDIHMMPLSFSEFFHQYNGTQYEAWNEYMTYGGLPLILSFNTDEEKSNYLKQLFYETYFKDIIERNNLQKDEILERLVDILASSVGSLTNPYNISKTFNSFGIKDINNKTISAYIDYLIEGYVIHRVDRYDVKGRKYISTPSKYYFSDVGLRNARLNFRQFEENHLMENIIYNELLYRGYNVDVGVVELNVTDNNNNNIRKQLEIDFVCNLGSKRYYIQSAFSIPDEIKMKQEKESLIRVKDSFKKIIVQKDDIKPWRTEEGILVMGIQEFLLNQNSLDL